MGKQTTKRSPHPRSFFRVPPPSLHACPLAAIASAIERSQAKQGSARGLVAWAFLLQTFSPSLHGRMSAKRLSDRRDSGNYTRR